MGGLTFNKKEGEIARNSSQHNNLDIHRIACSNYKANNKRSNNKHCVYYTIIDHKKKHAFFCDYFQKKIYQIMPSTHWEVGSTQSDPITVPKNPF
jgi:hypothetical protein